MNIPDALAKLTAQGDLNHIVADLAERGIRGHTLNAERCLIAEYLIAEGCVPRELGSVYVQPNRHEATGTVMVRTTRVPSEKYVTYTLPLLLNHLAIRFDCGQYPDLQLVPPALTASKGSPA